VTRNFHVILDAQHHASVVTIQCVLIAAKSYTRLTDISYTRVRARAEFAVTTAGIARTYQWRRI